MKYLVCLILSFCLVVQLFSQKKNDYVWLFGKDQQIDIGVQALKYDFNELPLSFLDIQ